MPRANDGTTMLSVDQDERTQHVIEKMADDLQEMKNLTLKRRLAADLDGLEVAFMAENVPRVLQREGSETRLRLCIARDFHECAELMDKFCIGKVSRHSAAICQHYFQVVSQLSSAVSSEPAPAPDSLPAQAEGNSPLPFSKEGHGGNRSVPVSNDAMTGDWRHEHPRSSYHSVCKEHPHNLWCKFNGYHLRDGACGWGYSNVVFTLLLSVILI